MKNKILTILILITFTNIIFSQKINNSNFKYPEITKEQMYSDFDEFVKILENCAVQLPVKKQVTGFDNLTEIKNLRKNIDTVSNTKYFYYILYDAIRLMKDYNTSVVDCYLPEYEKYSDIDIEYIKQYSDYIKTKTIEPENIEQLKNSYFPVPAYYFDGNYYFGGEQDLVNKNNNKDTLKISIMKLISFNGNSPDYLQEQKQELGEWDFLRKRFYCNALWLPTKGILNVEQDGKMFSINLEDYVYDKWGLSIATTTVKLDGIPEDKDRNSFVEFFDKDSILFICIIGAVENSDFITKIKKVGKNKKIKKVIIDVRNGGSDLAWQNVLKAIIKDPLSYKIDLAYNDTEIMQKKFKEYEKISKPETINWLNNQKVRIINEENKYIVPDKNSLKYSGNIYILINYFNTSLVAFCSYQDKLVSVGTVSTRLSGFDKKTTLFQLKHSKFTFRLSTTMDITNCTKPEDIYHAFPEVVVNPSFEDGFLYKYSIYDTKSEEYLRKYDKIFKKVLELK